MRRLILAILLFPIFISAQQKFADLGNFKLESNSVIEHCKLGYRTFGRLNKDKSNVIIFPTWFGGTSEHVSSLVGENDKLVDSTKFFVIIFDAFGNGISSSPSNSGSQPDTLFPRFSIADMIEAQHKMMIETLDIHHVYGAIGGSMGSMQIFEWIVKYPNFIEKALPYVCSPFRSSNDLLYQKTQLQIIESGRKAGMCKKEIMKSLKMMQLLLARTPKYVVENVDRLDFNNYLKKFDTPAQENFPLANWEYQLRAMYNQDITKYFDYDISKTAKAIKTKLLMIVSKTDHLLNPSSAIELSKALGNEIIILDNNCGHLAIGCEMEKVVKIAHEFFRKN
ncbi:MAG: alpha/beta fold hydrolase [Melioribacteraceae bacterium]|nr:alpha/beta fold hydrolase [Melioribacteraceae bacterium]